MTSSVDACVVVEFVVWSVVVDLVVLGRIVDCIVVSTVVGASVAVVVGFRLQRGS